MRINKLSMIGILLLFSLISFVYATTSGTNIVISEVLYNANGSNEAGKEWFELYPDKKLYGVSNRVFMDYHRRFPQRHCCQLFFGKVTLTYAKDYLSILPLLEEKQEETIPEDKGLSCKEFIFANDL